MIQSTFAMKIGDVKLISSFSASSTKITRQSLNSPKYDEKKYFTLKQKETSKLPNK